MEWGGGGGGLDARSHATTLPELHCKYIVVNWYDKPVPNAIPLFRHHGVHDNVHNQTCVLATILFKNWICMDDESECTTITN